MKAKTGLLFLLLRLAKDRHARSHRLLARLLRDEEGSWLIYMTVALPVLIGVAGLGSEGGLLFYQHRSLQSAADAAAYSAAIAYSYDTTTNITTQAQATVASYGFALGTGTNQANVAATATTYASQPAVQVTISRPQTAIFSSIFFAVLPNSVSATAVLDSSKSGNCLLALGKTTTGTDAADAIYGQGNPSINVPGCGVFSNSTSTTSIALGGNASMTAGSVGSAGTVSGGSHITLTGGGTYTQGDGQISDPYAGTPFPSTGACLTWTATPSPGYYCNDVTIKHVTVTLQPGVYIFGGHVTIGPGGGTLNGSDVTLAFTSTSTGMDIDSNSVVNLSAPTSGPTAGFVMLGASNMPLNTPFNTHSNPSVTLTGTVYVPNGAFSWGGTPTTGSGACLQYIVNTFTLQGNSGVSGSGCSLSNGQKPIGSIVTLVD